MTFQEDKDIESVVLGQCRQQDDLAKAIDEFAQDSEMDALRAKADALLGLDAADPRASPPADVAPPTPATPTWEDVRRTHAGTQGSIQNLLSPDDRQAFAEDWRAFLSEVETRIDEESMTALVRATRDQVIQSLLVPFGLGSLVARKDHRGGAVLTEHHAVSEAHGPSASKLPNQEKLSQFRQDIETPYKHSDYAEGFPARRKAMFQSQPEIRDAYTGKELPKDGRMHLDHVRSAKEIHEDPGLTFHLGNEGKRRVAMADENIVPTDSSLNQSKGETPLSDWADHVRKDGTTNRDRYEVDDQRVRSADERARGYIEAEENAAALRYYGEESLKACGAGAARMGLQQALGLALAELIQSSFDEMVDIYRNGLISNIDNGSLDAVGRRLKTVASTVLSRWRDVLKAAAGGGISGAVSALATTAINLFVTTSRRLVRIIREGIFSLGRAIWMLVTRPNEMTLVEAAHEASKLVAGGLAVGLGVVIEEAAEKAIASTTVLAPFAPYIAPVFAGLTSGLLTVLAVHTLDRMDLFGVEEDRRNEKVLDAVDARIQRGLDELEAALMPVAEA